jgi:hypothetical protein
MTHPIRSISLERPDDRFELQHMRTICPRGSEQLFIDYSKQANQVIRDVASSEGVCVLDMEAQFNGHRDAFVDLIHFSDSGSRATATFIADWLTSGPLADAVGGARVP